MSFWKPIIHFKKNKGLLKPIIILDLLVGLLVLFVFAFFVFNKYQKKQEWVDVSINLTNDYVWDEQKKTQYWYVENLNKGDSSHNSFGEENAILKDIISYEVGGEYVKTEILVSLKVSYDQKNNQYMFNYQPLKVGKPIELSFEKNSIRGVVTALDNQEFADNEYTNKTIKVKLIKTRPWTADALKEGSVFRDKNGLVLAEILDKEVSIYTTQDFSDIRGRYIKTFNPDYRDVILTISVKSFYLNDTYFFINGTPLRVGNKIWLFFPEASVEEASIIEVLD